MTSFVTQADVLTTNTGLVSKAPGTLPPAPLQEAKHWLIARATVSGTKLGGGAKLDVTRRQRCIRSELRLYICDESMIQMKPIYFNDKKLKIPVNLIYLVCGSRLPVFSADKSLRFKTKKCNDVFEI